MNEDSVARPAPARTRDSMANSQQISRGVQVKATQRYPQGFVLLFTDVTVWDIQQVRTTRSRMR